MSGSEPDEMAPESSKVVVLPKFDMHIYTSELTSSELTTTIEEYGIPMDLRSRLSFPAINMDTFLKLPTWTGTTVSRGIPFLRSNGEEGTKKPGKATAKRAGAGGAKDSKRKRKVQENNESVQSGPKRLCRLLLFVKLLMKLVIVDLNGNTRVSTPSTEVNQPSPHHEHHDTHVSPIYDVHSPQFSYHNNEDELVANRYVPNWGLRNDLRKVYDSYDLSMSELLAVSPDAPPPLVTKRTTSGVAVEDDAQQSPSSASKITSNTSFNTTI
uniref:Uncharacterized protein n=1 Tax=Tanacetum cinerariifolium TaxID=118510 RepID=A0A6L2LKQ1_TANCI|nr:hypothetical protein [Tanacetum cinerariifolium]